MTLYFTRSLVSCEPTQAFASFLDQTLATATVEIFDEFLNLQSLMPLEEIQNRFDSEMEKGGGEKKFISLLMNLAIKNRVCFYWFLPGVGNPFLAEGIDGVLIANILEIEKMDLSYVWNVA